jgi:hypothetical protein
MGEDNRYKDFAGRYFARGAVGVSVGLAAISPTVAAVDLDASRGEQSTARSFSDRLSNIRSSVSEHVDESLAVAQITRPPPTPQPFKNFFGKQPFQDTFKNTPAPKK